jgi:hypothetical protein
LLQLATPASFPAGAIVFYPPFSKRQTAAPAFRFDLKGTDGRVEPWLFWLQGGPWGPDEKRRTASLCREMYGAEHPVPVIKLSHEVVISIELGLHAPRREDHSWTSALGAIASTTSGLKIAAADFSQHHQSPVPIDLATWLYDEDALRRQVYAWYDKWRVRISDGGDRTYGMIDYTPPVAPPR